MGRGLIAAAVMLLAVPPAAGTQQRTQQGAPPERGERAQEGRRSAIEQRVRERMGELVRTRLDLDDAAMRRLQTVSGQFEERRRALVLRERDVRREMREQLTAGDRANQGRVAELLDAMLAVQRERLDLVAAEQRELARFLTPVQRAKYLVMQEQMRRRIEEIARPGRGGPPRGGRPGQRATPPR